jgi:RHS repeat-associated protein
MTVEGRSGVTSADGRYKFTGKERDLETSYDYFGARYYDARIGRSLQADPLAEKYQAWSPFGYAAANPLRLLDQDGKEIENAFKNSNSPEYKYVERFLSEVRRSAVGNELYKYLDDLDERISVGIGMILDKELAKTAVALTGSDIWTAFFGASVTLDRYKIEIEGRDPVQILIHEFAHARLAKLQPFLTNLITNDERTYILEPYSWEYEMRYLDEKNREEDKSRKDAADEEDEGNKNSAQGTANNPWSAWLRSRWDIFDPSKR